MLSLISHVSFLIGELKTVVEYEKYLVVADDSIIVIADLEHFALNESICRKGLPCTFPLLLELPYKQSEFGAAHLHAFCKHSCTLCVCFSTEPCSFVRMLLQSQQGL